MEMRCKNTPAKTLGPVSQAQLTYSPWGLASEKAVTVWRFLPSRPRNCSRCCQFSALLCRVLCTFEVNAEMVGIGAAESRPKQSPREPVRTSSLWNATKFHFLKARACKLECKKEMMYVCLLFFCECLSFT